MSRQAGKYPDPWKIKVNFLDLLRRYIRHTSPPADYRFPLNYRHPVTDYRLAKEAGIDEAALRRVLAGKGSLRVDALLRLKEMALAAGPEAGFTKEIMESWEDEIRLARQRDGRVIDKTKILDPDTFRNKTVELDRGLAWAVKAIRHIAQSRGLPLREFLDRAKCSESALYRCEAGKQLLPWPVLWNIREIGAEMGKDDQIRTIDLTAWHCLCFPNERKEILS